VNTFAAATVTLTTLDGVEHKVQVRVDGHQSILLRAWEGGLCSLLPCVSAHCTCTVPCARAEGRLRVDVSWRKSKRSALSLCETARGMAQVDDGESILDAALDDGLDVPHDCKMGVCMTCPAKLLSGQVDHGVAMLSDDVIDQGFALLCTAIPMGDVVVKVVEEVGCLCWPARTLSTHRSTSNVTASIERPDKAGESCNIRRAPRSHVRTEPARCVCVRGQDDLLDEQLHG